MEFHLQENLTARRNGRNFSTTVNCAAERFCMLLPKKMSIFINTVDFIIDLKFTKRDATVITLKLPKKIFFPRKSKWFFVLFLWARNMKDFELMLLNCGTGEDSWQSLGCKEIKPVNPKGNHTWYFTCFNAILPNLPTLSLSLWVHKTVLYISVSSAVSYTGLLLPSF